MHAYSIACITKLFSKFSPTYSFNTGEKSETTSVDEFAQVLIAVYYPGLSRNSVSLEYLPGLEPVCKSNIMP